MAGTWKKITLVGTSTESLEEAIRGALKDASKSVRKMGWFEVTEQRGAIKDGKVTEFQVTIEVGFKVEA